MYRHRPLRATKRTTPPRGGDSAVRMNSLYRGISEISYFPNDTVPALSVPSQPFARPRDAQRCP